MTQDTPTEADKAAFGASEAACVLYPGEDQQPERSAFCAGAASMAVPMHIAAPALYEALNELRAFLGNTTAPPLLLRLCADADRALASARGE